MKATLILRGMDKGEPAAAALASDREDVVYLAKVSSGIYEDIARCIGIADYTKLELSATKELRGLSVSIPNESLYNWILYRIKKRTTTNGSPMC